MFSVTAVPTIKTFSGTSPYETEESPAEPTPSQKDASHKKLIAERSWGSLALIAALVATIQLEEIFGSELFVTFAAPVAVAFHWYKEYKRLHHDDDRDAKQSIPLGQRKRIFILFKFGVFGF